MSSSQIQTDAIDALIALGHKKTDAVRMVKAALASGVQPSSPQELLRAALNRPVPKGDATFTEIELQELQQIAAALPGGLTDELQEQVCALQAKRGEMTNKAYQAALWAIPAAFVEQRQSPVHFQPSRDSKGKPVETEQLKAPAKPEAFKFGDSVTAPGKSGALVPGVITGLLQDGRVGVETHEGYWPRKREQLEPYRPSFSPGDAVHLPRYASDSGGMGTVVSKQQDGTFEVNINGRLLTARPGDMQSPAGLAETPREAPIEAIGGPTEQAPSINVTQAIGGLINQPPAENDSGTFSSTLDKAQAVADAIGVVDQTGVTDLANAGVSLTRAFTEPGRAGEHLGNAAMRAVSAIPVIGDAAKLAKYGPQGLKALRGGDEGAKALLKQGDHPAAGSGKATFGGKVNAAAQAALEAIGGGSGGSGGGGGGGGTTLPSIGGEPPSRGNGSDPFLSGAALRQAKNDLSSFGSAIEKLLNTTGAAGAVVATVGKQVYDKALAPLIKWFKDVDDASKSMLENSRDLAQYSGTVGAAFQKLEVDRFLRSVEKAQDMGGSISRLAGSQSRSEQAQQDLFMPYQKLGIELQSMRTEVVGTILKVIDSIDVIGGFIDWWLGDQRMKNAIARNDLERAQEMIDKHLPEKKLKN